MVKSGACCVDVLQPLSAAHETLRNVGKLLKRRHLQNCMTGAHRSAEYAEVERTCRELMYVIRKFCT